MWPGICSISVRNARLLCLYSGRGSVPVLSASGGYWETP